MRYIESTITLPFPAVNYTGPGDVVSGAVGWWGLRAYSAASIGGSTVRLRRDNDNSQQDFVTLSTGALDVASIASFKGSANLLVTRLYDQTGGGLDLVQATAASQPTFTLSGIGSLPILSGTGSSTLQSATNISRAQPFTVSTVARSAASTSTSQNVSGSGGAVAGQGGFGVGGINHIWLYGGASANVAATDHVWRALQWVFNGAASDINVDGTVNTVSGGSGSYTGVPVTFISNVGGNAYLGDCTEIGIWPVAFTATNSSNLSSNQHSYWGF